MGPASKLNACDPPAVTPLGGEAGVGRARPPVVRVGAAVVVRSHGPPGFLRGESQPRDEFRHGSAAHVRHDVRHRISPAWVRGVLVGHDPNLGTRAVAMTSMVSPSGDGMHANR